MKGLLFAQTVTAPLKDSDYINMEQGDRRKTKNFGKDFMSRLQCVFSSTPASTDLSKHVKHNPDEVLMWSQSLEKLLESKSGLVTFHAFLKSEFSDENIEFWLTCEDYKKIRCSHRRASKAKKIYEQFIVAEAPKEINIDHQTRETIKAKVQTPTKTCFDEAQKIVYGLMERDSYPRFLKSDIYKSLSSKPLPGSVKG
ncbi:regulator of G-protein signaling 21 [Amia ocellicauda]|uniref:regulator of G-protein signaling 21 n=1 Tax=Amia ocellicauda TaxID=2972642 RepID=UPI0034644307